LLQFLRQDKAYQATIRLGGTTTDDLEGEIGIATHLWVEPRADWYRLSCLRKDSAGAAQLQRNSGAEVCTTARAGEKIEVTST